MYNYLISFSLHLHSLVVALLACLGSNPPFCKKKKISGDKTIKERLDGTKKSASFDTATVSKLADFLVLLSYFCILQ